MKGMNETMKTEVVYYSRSGNTKKVADAIAQELGKVSKPVPLDYPIERTGILFLGAGAYKGKVSKKMKEFIDTLTLERARNVVLFGTSVFKDQKHLTYMRNLIKAKGINVYDETFNCPGKLFLLKAGSPNDNDLKEAREFARSIMKKYS